MDIDRTLEKLGFAELNPMQKKAIETIGEGTDDVVILSPTGSGKTLAYLLPLIEKVDASLSQIQVVVVVPGRELALQSQTVLKNLGCGLRSMALYGGRATMDEHRQMREIKPQVVFATLAVSEIGVLADVHIRGIKVSYDAEHGFILAENDFLHGNLRIAYRQTGHLFPLLSFYLWQMRRLPVSSVA